MESSLFQQPSRTLKRTLSAKECIKQWWQNVLSPIIRDESPRNQQNASEAIDDALAKTVFALRAAVLLLLLHLKHHLLISLSYIYDIKFCSRCWSMKHSRTHILYWSAARENKGRPDHDYSSPRQLMNRFWLLSHILMSWNKDAWWELFR